MSLSDITFFFILFLFLSINSNSEKYNLEDPNKIEFPVI